MKLDGYWVSGAGDKVWLTQYGFDETELSSKSGWTQAWENGQGDYDGFVSSVPGDLINNVCGRILRREPRFVDVDPSSGHKGEIIHVGTLESFASFISRLNLKAN